MKSWKRRLLVNQLEVCGNIEEEKQALERTGYHGTGGKIVRAAGKLQDVEKRKICRSSDENMEIL